MRSFRFEAPASTPAAEATRARVRAFLADERAQGRFSPNRCSWSTFDPAFSRRAGAAGFIGITWPKAYGGQERSNGERFAVAEEMLAAGAPVGAHWIADRQSGPQILKHGSERARATILPRIAAGACYFGIGMSEPGSGSDLAAVRTRAERVEGGWRVNGSKIWTSHAHRADYLIALVRTSPPGEDRHAGLTQFIVDLRADGVTVRPIRNMAGEHEFNEVFFDDHVVPDDMVLGAAGDGWDTVTKELSLERGGPDRFLSDFRLLAEAVDRIGPAPDVRQAAEVGRLVAHGAALRRMAAAVSGLVDRGESPALEAALLKDVGTAFERELPERLRHLLPAAPSVDADGFDEAMADVLLRAPSFTIRGGTPEVLRGMIARGLGLR